MILKSEEGPGSLSFTQWGKPGKFEQKDQENYA